MVGAEVSPLIYRASGGHTLDDRRSFTSRDYAEEGKKVMFDGEILS